MLNKFSKNLIFNMGRDVDQDFPLVICFYHAGGRSSIYNKWETTETVRIATYELPGHGSRITESCITDIRVLTNLICDEIREYVRISPVTLFGHSLGALIAFTVAVKLEKDFGLLINKLIIASRHSPDIFKMENYTSDMGVGALQAEMRRVGGMPSELLDSKEYLDFFLPLVYNDYKLHESFRYQQDRVSVPIVAYYGDEDCDVSEEEVLRWQNVTTAKLVAKRFKGGHFFLIDALDVFLDELQGDISSKKTKTEGGNTNV